MITTSNFSNIYNSQIQNRNKPVIFESQNNNIVKKPFYNNINCQQGDIFFKAASTVVQKKVSKTTPIKSCLYKGKKHINKLSKEQEINYHLLVGKIKKGKDSEAKSELLATVLSKAKIDDLPMVIAKAKEIVNIAKKIESDETLKDIMLLALYDESGRVRAAAYKVLGDKFNNAKKTKILLMKFLKNDHCKLAQTEIIRTLGRNFPADKDVKDALKEIFIKNKSVRVRVAAAKVLGDNYPDKATRDLLLGFLIDDKKTKTEWLKTFKPAHDTGVNAKIGKVPTKEKTPQIVLDEPKHLARIRVAIIKILAAEKFKPNENIEAALKEIARKDKSFRVKFAATKVLKEKYHSDKEAKDFLIGFFTYDNTNSMGPVKSKVAAQNSINAKKIYLMKWKEAFAPKDINWKRINNIRTTIAKILGKDFISDKEVTKVLVNASKTENNKKVREASALYLNRPKSETAI